jgi:hypothetical protein
MNSKVFILRPIKVIVTNLIRKHVEKIYIPFLIKVYCLKGNTITRLNNKH